MVMVCSIALPAGVLPPREFYASQVKELTRLDARREEVMDRRRAKDRLRKRLARRKERRELQESES